MAPSLPTSGNPVEQRLLVDADSRQRRPACHHLHRRRHLHAGRRCARSRSTSARRTAPTESTTTATEVDCADLDCDGTPCDDGAFCTENDSCQNGTCTAGGARDCGDPSTCTADSCNEASRSVRAPAGGRTTRRATTVRSARDTDTCQGGTCVPGPARDCSRRQRLYGRLLQRGRRMPATTRALPDELRPAKTALFCSVRRQPVTAAACVAGRRAIAPTPTRAPPTAAARRRTSASTIRRRCRRRPATTGCSARTPTPARAVPVPRPGAQLRRRQRLYGRLLRRGDERAASMRRCRRTRPANDGALLHRGRRLSQRAPVPGRCATATDTSGCTVDGCNDVWTSAFTTRPRCRGRRCDDGSVLHRRRRLRRRRLHRHGARLQRYERLHRGQLRRVRGPVRQRPAAAAGQPPATTRSSAP